VERKALKEKLDRLTHRLQQNAKVQEGDRPAEEPTTLLAEVETVLAELEQLTVRINRTNMATTLPDDPNMTLMEAIAQRDRLAWQRKILGSVVEAAAITRDRWAVTRSEIRFRPTVDVAALQKQIDALAKAYRELDTRIQAANWATEMAG